jgi:hypothetical protein
MISSRVVLFLCFTGIAAYGDGLILVSPPRDDDAVLGLYYYAEAADTIVWIADGPEQGGSVLVVDNTLYLTDTMANAIVVMDLVYDERTSSVNATRVGYLISPLLDAPLFSAIYENSLYSIAFSTTPMLHPKPYYNTRSM